MRSSITLAPQLHAAKAERVGGLGEEKRWRFSYPNSPEVREIKHTLKYDRLKLPTTFFTDKNGQVQIQTDIYEQQVYRADVRPGKLLFRCVFFVVKDWNFF
jgi:hypothetical protein